MCANFKITINETEEEKIETAYENDDRLELIPEEICQHPISLVNVPLAHADSSQHPPPEAKGSVGVGWTRIGGPFLARFALDRNGRLHRSWKVSFFFKYLYAY